MITEPEAAQRVRQSWEGVVALRARLQRNAAFSFTMGMFFPHALADAAQNLPFMHAYAVLADALQTIAQEHDHPYKGRELGRLLNENRTQLGWQTFDMISEGKALRDAVAHRGELVPRGECWKYIDAVGGELRHWGLIAAEETA